MSQADYESLMRFSRKVALAVEGAVDCLRVGLTVIGLEVPHVHVHIIPLNEMADATFQRKATLSPERFEEVAASIRAKLQ